MNELLGNEAARGLDLALTPAVFGGIGWLLDARLGTGPWLALGLAALAIVSTVAKMWFGYDARMRELESTSRWSRRAAAPTPPSDVDRDLWAERKAQA